MPPSSAFPSTSYHHGRQRAAQTYQQAIATHLGTRVQSIDPRHVEGWMRVEHGTLDHLDAFAFQDEIELAVACIAAAGPRESEQLARSYGL